MEGENPPTRLNEDEGDVCSSDSIHLQHILPEEIWKLITEKVVKESPTQFENLANSSPFFRNLLARQLTTHPFENVFQLVAASVWRKEGLEGLPLSEVFKCRAVCSKWNAAIDKLIPDKFQHLGRKGSRTNLTPIGLIFDYFLAEHNWFTNSLDWSTEKSVQNFLLHFQHTHPPHPPSNQVSKSRNPLIWRELAVKVAYDGEDVFEDYLQYLEDITLLLSKYGHHVLKFSLDIDKDNFLDEGLRLQEWFSKMPNLNVLTFESDWWEDSEPDLNYYRDDWNALEKLNNLQTLEIKALPPPIFTQLIRQNSQISKLILSYWYVQYYFFLEPLPNLKELEFEFGSPVIIDQLFVVRWPLLETLKITIHDNDFDNSYFVDCADLFPVLEIRFGASLVSLEIDTSVDNEEAKGALYDVCRNGKLNLPNLKKIRLHLGGVINCLDFLLPMKDGGAPTPDYPRAEYSP